MKFDSTMHTPAEHLHRRASTRLKGYDYALAGAYFITIVTYQRDLLFGEIVKGNIHLSRRGEIVQEEWFRSAEIRKEIRLFADEFVMMPNHIHGIVWIVEDESSRVINDAPHIDMPNGVGADGLSNSIIHPNSVGATGRSPHVHQRKV